MEGVARACAAALCGVSYRSRAGRRFSTPKVAVKELTAPQSAAAARRFGGGLGDGQPTQRAGWRRGVRGGGSKSGSKSSSDDSQTAADPSFVREVEFLSKLRHPNSCVAGVLAWPHLVAHGSLSASRLSVAAIYAVQLRPRALLIMELGTGGRRGTRLFFEIF